MKNKKKTFMGLVLLLAVLVLGVGYALTAADLTVSGTATANTATSGFTVEFSKAEKGANDTTEITEITTNGTAATMNVSLTNVGDEATGTFTIKNNSDAGMIADLSKAVIAVTANDKSDYFEVTYGELSEDEIAVGGEATFTVTIKLIKANVSDTAVTGNYTVKLNGINSKQA